jgi:hypothetical protein
MKFITTMLATASLAFAAGCAPTTANQASLGAVSATTTSCCAQKAAATACCANKTDCTAEQKAACAATKAAKVKPALSAVEGAKAASGCCASKAKAPSDKPALSAVEASTAKSGCCSSQKATSGCPFSKKTGDN